MTPTATRITIDLLDSAQHLRVDPEDVRFSRELGSGGHGTVHVGRLWRSGRPALRVAIKQISPRGTLREEDTLSITFLRELNVWAKLRSPNILTLEGFCYDVEKSIYWLISPYMKTGNVFRFVTSTQPTTYHRTRLVWDVARGLEYLHSNGICHGNLKGDNVLVDDVGRARLCDFGVSKMLSEAYSTATSMPLATQRYQPPEAMRSELETVMYTFGGDIWALGCVALEIMAGIRPYDGITDVLLLQTNISQGTLPAALDTVDIPQDSKQLIATCWDPVPTNRPLAAHCQVDAAIAFHKAHIAAPTPDQDPDKDRKAAHRLSVCLISRFDRLGRKEDAEEALEYASMALERWPQGDPAFNEIVVSVERLSLLLRQDQQATDENFSAGLDSERVVTHRYYHTVFDFLRRLINGPEFEWIVLGLAATYLIATGSGQSVLELTLYLVGIWLSATFLYHFLREVLRLIR